MLARLANATARARLQQTLGGLSPDADLRALDAVREHVERQVADVQLGRDLADTDLEHRLGVIRDAEASAAPAPSSTSSSVRGGACCHG